MRIFRNAPDEISREMGQIGLFSDWSIRRKFLTAILPVAVVVLLVTGLANHSLFTSYISIALERNSLLQTKAQAHALETLLASARDELLLLASRPVDAQALRSFLETRAVLLDKPYAEIAFLSADSRNQLYFLVQDGAIIEPSHDMLPLIQGNPLQFSKKSGMARPGAVALSELSEVVYPPTLAPGSADRSLAVFRLSTPVLAENGSLGGYLVLSLDARAARNLLTLYNSAKSPLYGFPRAPENRLSVFVDDRGWMLFESDTEENDDKPLSVGAAIAAMAGDHGKPGYDEAFRPNAASENYWRIITEMQAGRTGLDRSSPDFGPARSPSSVDFVGFSPVFFRPSPKEQPLMAGGVIYIDRSLLPSAAEFGQINLMLGITVGAALLLSLLIFLVSRTVTRPIMRLTAAVTTMRSESRLDPIDVPDCDRETGALARAINDLTASLAFKDRALRKLDDDIKVAHSRERATLCAETEIPGNADNAANAANAAMAALIGACPAMVRLKERIRKVAASDADVLLIGETGTGKELTAEAVHLCGPRANGPYVSINCGALDENLLMDALFGHVKGAFTEAKTERKGAFLAAEGGSLHLDEIGNASPKVQQSLLRALSVRRIRPLGSDQEIAFSVKVLAATNENLLEMVHAGTFREDLYYRLQVLTISTPPLRQRTDDIPLLTEHFLRQAARRFSKPGLGISRGALDKLTAHHWPGNVRELQHCLIRAAILCESDLLQADDIHLEDGLPFPQTEKAMPEEADAPALVRAADVPPLPRQPDVATSPRQARAMPHILKNGGITRAEYQRLLGDLPPRTAIFDLSDLVKKGILVKVGSGPSTRYALAPKETP